MYLIHYLLTIILISIKIVNNYTMISDIFNALSIVC